MGIGLKYTIIFLIMALSFFIAILAAYFFLSGAQGEMLETERKNNVANDTGELIASYQEKYTFIPEYILLADEEMLSAYLEASKELMATAKLMKPNLSADQLPVFEKMIKNNDQLDQYFFITVVPKVQDIDTAQFETLQTEVSALRECKRVGAVFKRSA